MSTAGPFEIRALEPDEWDALRNIRLHGLKTCPSVFSSNYAREAAYTEADWRDWLSRDGKCMFGLFHEMRLIGITGIFILRDDATTAKLGASFIHEDYRGQGLARMLYAARLNWAKNQPGLKRVIVSHRAGNDISRRANQAWGFVRTKRQPHTWPDGITEDEINYELAIETLASKTF